MSTTLPELRVALLGQGFMGKAHSNAYAQVGRFFDVPFRVRLKLLCGRDQASLEHSASQWGWEETSTDWRNALDRPDIDLIDIALPNHLHAEVAIAAAKAGKIVLCEKPFANTVEQAQSMVQAVAKVRTMVWFNYRRVPAVAYAKQLIEEGHLGTIYHYRGSYQQQWGPDKNRPVNWKMDPEQAGHGVVGDLLSHAADLALYLNGPIERLTASTHIFQPGRKVEDATASLITFQNGSVGSLEATRFGIGSLNRNTFEIQGEKGMLRFNLENLNNLEFFDATEEPSLQGTRTLSITGPQHPYGKNFWKPGHIIGYEHSFIGALGDFLISLKKEEPFHPDFNDGLQVQQVLDAVLRSAQSHQWETVSA